MLIKVAYFSDRGHQFQSDRGTAKSRSVDSTARLAQLLTSATRPRIDKTIPAHHDALMRTTVDIPENLHRIASGLARHTGRSLSQAVAELMQRGLDAQPVDAAAAVLSRHPETGLPVARSKRPITADDVKAIEDAA